jgi:arylsulfatase
VTGDHGESFERGYLNHGEELYENSTRVPLIIRFPRQRVGFKVSALTQLADVAPTILRALLIPVPTWMDGQPLMPGKAPAGVATVAVNYPLYLEASNRYVLPTKLALWWDRYKMIVTCASGAVELYDLNSDPSERVNLAGRKVELVADLRRRLSLQLAKQSHEPKLECSVPPVDSKSS